MTKKHLVFTIFALLLPCLSHGVDWDGGGANDLWSNDDNWDAAHPNGIGAIATFGSSVPATVTVDLTGGPFGIGELTFDPPSGEDINLDNSSLSFFKGSGNNTIDIPASATGTYSIDCDVTIANRPLRITHEGPNTFTFSGVFNNVSAQPQVTMISSSNRTVEFVGSNPNTGTSNFFITGGTMRFNKDDNVASISGTLSPSSGGTANFGGTGQFTDTSVISLNGGTIELNGHDQTLDRFIVNGATSTFSSSGATVTLKGSFNPAVTINDSNTINGDFVIDNASTGLIIDSTIGSNELQGTLDLGQEDREFQISPSVSLLVSAVISGDAGTGVMQTSGSGTLEFTGTNTYDGGTTISAGTFIASSDSNFGSGPFTLDGGTFQPGTTFTLTKDIALTDDSSISTPSGMDLTAGGTITGGAGDVLTKEDTGTLTLNGANTFPGGLTLDAGTLIPGNATALGSGTTTINGGTFQPSTMLTIANDFAIASPCVFNIPTGNDLTLSGSFSGAGTYSKEGDGMLILDGAVSLPSAVIDVEAGSLQVDSTYSVAEISVKSGGTLGGTGTITTTAGVEAESGGTVAPGASIGTLSITGPFTLLSGSTLLIEIDDSPASDLVDITGPGAVTIEAGAILELAPIAGVFLPGFSYTVLQADTMIMGGGFQNEDVVFTSPGFEATVVTTSMTVEVAILATGGFVDLETLFSTRSSGNARQVALCLDQQNIQPGTDLEAVGAALNPITNDPNAIQDALDQLQPAIFGALNLIQESQMTLMQSTFFHRLEAFGNGACSDLSPNTWTFWVKPVGEWINQRSYGQNVGFHVNSYGGMIGADHKFFDYLHLGFAGGYVHNDTKWKRSRGKTYSHNVYGGVYAAWQQRTFHVLASLIGGWNDYHAKRFMKFTTLNRTAKHDNHGKVLGCHVEGAWAHVKNNTRLQPYGKFEYTYSSQDSYREHGAGVLNLDVQGKKSGRIRTDLGLDLSQCYRYKSGQIVPNVYVSWVWEKETKNRKMTATFHEFDCPMSLKAISPIRSIFAPGAGITGTFCNDRVSLALRWDGEFAKRYSNQKGLIEATFGF